MYLTWVLGHFNRNFWYIWEAEDWQGGQWSTYCLASQEWQQRHVLFTIFSKTLTCTQHLSYRESIDHLCFKPILRLGSYTSDLSIISPWSLCKQKNTSLSLLAGRTVVVKTEIEHDQEMPHSQTRHLDSGHNAPSQWIGCYI